jgi:hypothetical protein
MSTLEERIARLEVKVGMNENLLVDIDKKVTNLSEQLLKHKGFFGGVVFAVSALWAIILVGIEILIRSK